MNSDELPSFLGERVRVRGDHKSVFVLPVFLYFVLVNESS